MIVENQLLIDEVQKANINIERVAYVKANPRWNRDSHKIINNMFYLVTEGEADIWCNGTHIPMKPGNIYIIPKDTIRAYNCPQYMEKLYFYAHMQSSNGIEIPIAPPGGYVLSGREEMISKMTALYQKKDYQSAILLRLYIEQIVSEVFSRFSSKPTIQDYSSLIRSVLQIIADAPHLSLSADSLAEQTHSSPSLLRKRFKEEVGISLGKFIQSQVLSSAMYDMHNHKLTLQEISSKYGFCDQFYFSRLFSAHYGMSPSRYRKEHIM